MISHAQSMSMARAARRRGPTRSLAAIGAVAAVALIASACGSSTPSGSPSPTTLAQSPAGVPAATTRPTASGTTVLKASSNATIGSDILVDTAGMTLYTLSADTGGMSTCNGTCASAWPPLVVGSGVTPAGAGIGGTLATTTRSDGSLQVTYDGQPLYSFAGDASAGATSGNGIKSFGGTWAVVKVTGATPGASPSGTGAPAKTPTTTTTKASSGGGYGY